MFLILFTIFIPISSQNQSIVLFPGYPSTTFAFCETLLNATSLETCQTTLRLDSSLDFLFFNSSASTCCLGPFQYIWKIKITAAKSGNPQVIGLKTDNYWGDSCPSENPLYYNNTASAGDSYFRISVITGYSNLIQVWNRDCGTGWFSMRNGSVQCWQGYAGDNGAVATPNDIKAAIKTCKDTMTSPQDVPTIKWAMLASMDALKITQAALVLDGSRNTNCSTSDTMRLSRCEYPQGFTLIDSANPNLDIFTFVDEPSYDVEYNCVVMYFDANDTDVTGKIDYASCTSKKAANGFAVIYGVRLM